MKKTAATEQRGVCAGGKKPTARSIKQVFQTFLKFEKPHSAGQKDFFDTLTIAERLYEIEMTRLICPHEMRVKHIQEYASYKISRYFVQIIVSNRFFKLFEV